MADTPTTARLADLQALELDAGRMIVRDRPGSDALFIALLKPRNFILRRYREALEAMEPDEAETLRRASVGLLSAAGGALVGPLGRLMDPADDGPPALISVAEAAVAKAILGDSAMIEGIWNRIEGRVGTRKEDVDADMVNRRGEMILAIETTLKALQEKPGDTATVVEAKPVTNGKGVTDVEIEDTVRKLYEDGAKPNGKGTPKKPPNGDAPEE